MRVQEEIVRRARLETGIGKRRVYSGKYALSSIMYCAHCGDIFQRTHWDIHGRKEVVCRCVSSLRKKEFGIDCPARTLHEPDLHEAIVTGINQDLATKDDYLTELKESVTTALADTNTGAVAEVDAEIEKLQKELIKKANEKQSYKKTIDKIDELLKKKRLLLLEDANKEGARRNLADIEVFFEEQTGEITMYDESLVRRMIENIDVYDDKITIIFKSGLDTEVAV